MKVALVGYAVENQAAFRYWQKRGADITICDQNDQLAVPDGVDTQLGPEYLNDLSRFDVIVRTSGMHPRIILDKNPDVGDKITTAVNIFFEQCEKPIIGVTGTKGKGTTSTLITKILEAAGKTILLGGNIGIPMLDLLDEQAEADYVVLELSSFQLIDLKYSPQTATVLMVVPEHLNWHADLEEYLAAKQNLFSHQAPDNLAIFNRNSTYSHQIAEASLGHKLSYEVPGPGAQPTNRTGAYVDNDMIYMNDTPVCATSEVALLGRHNLENVCAAIATTWEIILHDTDVIKQVVSGFTGLEFRLEPVREVNGVRYYNDSFGTTPETAIVAIQAFDAPKVVILGGSDKGAEYDDLAHVVATNNVKAAIVIGDVADKIKQSLTTAGFENILDGGDSMSSIMSSVQSQVAPGDVVLLSTGCASFGLFKDYKDRGNQFNEVVNSL